MTANRFLNKHGPPRRPLRAAVLVLVWLGVIVLCLIHRDALSADGIASLAPRSPWLAALVLLLLFALKSLSVVLYSGILYAASGILFPLPAAILLNMAGTVIMVSLPYWLGRRGGACAVEALRAKYPNMEKLHTLRRQNDVLFSFLARMLRLPSDVVSLYMGAVHVPYGGFLLGSFLGILPTMVTFPIMGMSAGDVGSPEFLISLGAELLYVLLAAGFCVRHRRRHPPGAAQPAPAASEQDAAPDEQNAYHYHISKE